MASGTDGTLMRQLRRAQSSGDYTAAVALLRQLGPSALDGELRSYLAWDESQPTAAEVDRLRVLCRFLEHELVEGRNFDLVNAVLAVVLEAHGTTLMQDASLRRCCDRLRKLLVRAWGRLRGALDEVACAVGFVGKMHV